MQLKPINTATSHLQYHWFPPHPQKRKPRQEGDRLLYIRQTWLHPKGAEMVRGWRLSVGMSRSQTGLSRISQVSPSSLDGRCSFETPISWG